jgi:phenylpyruvate tautomerase PptA (4-oxalocrotonate tautomerase family)
VTAVWATVPEGTLGGVTETLLRVGLAAAVLEELGERTVVDIEEARNGGWGVGGDLAAEPGSYRCFIRVTLGAELAAERAAGLADALSRWVGEVLGPAPAWAPAATWVEVDQPAELSDPSVVHNFHRGTPRVAARAV